MSLDSSKLMYEATLGRYRQKYVDFPESSCLLFVVEVLHASLSVAAEDFAVLV